MRRFVVADRGVGVTVGDSRGVRADVEEEGRCLGMPGGGRRPGALGYGYAGEEPREEATMERGVMWGEKRVCLLRGSVRPSLAGGSPAPAPAREEERDAGGGKMNCSGSELKLWAVKEFLQTYKQDYKIYNKVTRLQTQTFMSHSHHITQKIKKRDKMVPYFLWLDEEVELLGSGLDGDL